MSEVNSNFYVTQLQFGDQVYNIRDEFARIDIDLAENEIGHINAIIKNRLWDTPAEKISTMQDGIVISLDKATLDALDPGIYKVILSEDAFNTTGPCCYYDQNGYKKEASYTDNEYGWITVNQNTSHMILIKAKPINNYPQITLINAKGRTLVDDRMFIEDLRGKQYPHYKDDAGEVVWIDMVEWRLNQRLKRLDSQGQQLNNLEEKIKTVTNITLTQNSETNNQHVLILADEWISSSGLENNSEFQTYLNNLYNTLYPVGGNGTIFWKSFVSINALLAHLMFLNYQRGDPQRPGYIINEGTIHGAITSKNPIYIINNKGIKSCEIDDNDNENEKRIWLTDPISQIRAPYMGYLDINEEQFLEDEIIPLPMFSHIVLLTSAKDVENITSANELNLGLNLNKAPTYSKDETTGYVIVNPNTLTAKLAAVIDLLSQGSLGRNIYIAPPMSTLSIGNKIITTSSSEITQGTTMNASQQAVEAQKIMAIVNSIQASVKAHNMSDATAKITIINSATSSINNSATIANDKKAAYIQQIASAINANGPYAKVTITSSGTSGT